MLNLNKKKKKDLLKKFGEMKTMSTTNKEKLTKIKEERRFYKNLGHLLYTTRRLRGHTQDDMCRVIGLTRKTYALIERGESSIKLFDYIMLSSFYKVHYTLMLSHINKPLEFEKAIEDIIEAEIKLEEYRNASSIQQREAIGSNHDR